ncbi:MAG: DUF779 domain-containing protein [Thermoplasmata archaeon]
MGGQPTFAMGVRFTAQAQGLIRRLRKRHPDLYLLLDDTGCCGPSSVFLQQTPPSPVYETMGRVDGVEVYIHPSFAGDRAQAYTVDAYPSETDDSFSLETALGHRLTLGFRSAPKNAGDPTTDRTRARGRCA